METGFFSQKNFKDSYFTVKCIRFLQKSKNICDFWSNDVFYILGEFEGDRISPRESAKNGRNGTDGLNCLIFVKSELIFEIYDENYPRKKFSRLYDTFEIFVNFEISAIFEISKGNLS